MNGVVVVVVVREGGVKIAHNQQKTLRKYGGKKQSNLDIQKKKKKSRFCDKCSREVSLVF